ncbi:MAG: RIP metalloprotease RseP [Proteobacteria bacterium]|nr:RIP metalloprotease RseP [Pseudomonadota bacterium]
MTVLEYLVAVIPMFGVLIFVHELGHFLVAKACGVRVLKFSLGFGSPVGFGRHRLRWERGGTEYVVAWFPLGGFVKMLGENLHIQGEDDPEVVADARPDEFLNAKPTWQKLSIVFAGPAMNLLLPVLAFTVVLAVGVSRPAAVVGMVESGSPAALAGIASGDRIVSIDGEPVEWWEDVENAVRARTEGALELRIERSEQEFAAAVPVAARAGLDEFGASTRTGWIGIEHWRLPAVLGVPTDGVPAARAGLLSGDQVTRVGDTEVEDWEQLVAAYAAGSGEIELELLRRGSEEPLTLTVPALGGLDALGVVPATVLIEDVDPEMPAGRAGLQTGDLILTVDGRPVGSFASFQETVRASEGLTLTLAYSRDGEVRTVSLTPEEREIEGVLGIEETVYLIGIRHQPTLLPGTTRVEQERNPLVSIPTAVGMTVDKTGQFLRGLKKIITGEIGRDKLAGPIGIAEIARKSLDLGWQYYLYTMIFISINLGILNLLPIPVLDGGQALIFAVEGVKRAPISLRTREIVQQVGLTMILMLMGLAFWNDISRNWSKFVAWLTGSGS